jgi:hypothetical protein
VRVNVAAIAKPVTITGFQLHVLKRSAPLAGVVASCGGRGGSPFETRSLISNLDEEPVRTESYPAGSQRPDPTFAFTLKPGDSQVFDIVARTFTCFCEWEATIEGVAEGHTRKFPITDNGKPFATNASSDSTIVRYKRSRWVQVRSPGTR